jgi:hypothetical protein
MFTRSSRVIRLFAFAASIGLLLSFAAKASQQASSFTVPVSIVGGYVIVDLRLNGNGPFHFLFDTGAEIVVLEPAARKLALETKDWGNGFGDGERKVHWRRTTVRDVQIGALHLTDRVVGVLPTDDVEQSFGTYPLSGFIGTPLLKGMVVKLDYDRRQLTLTPADQFAYSGSGTVLPFVDGRTPAMLDGIQQDLFVDTGTLPGLSLGTFAYADHHLSSKDAAPLQGITDWGAGGPVHTRLARGHLFELGSIKVRDPVLYLSLQKAGALASGGGRIGFGILSRFNVIFDSSRSRIILERNASFGRADPYDRLGMWMGQAGEQFVAVDVVAGGPAAIAGVKRGDTITEIDGVSTAHLLLPEVREQMERRSASDRVRLSLQSGNSRRVVVVTLQDRV